MGKRTGDKKADDNRKSFTTLVREQVTEIYLVIMLGIFPLFLVKGYEDLVYRKWDLFRYSSFIFVLISLVTGVVCLLASGGMLLRKANAGKANAGKANAGKTNAGKANAGKAYTGKANTGKIGWKAAENDGKWFRGMSCTDWFVLAYLFCTVISYIGAVDKQTALWGVDTWYTGFLTQLLLVGIYFGVSRGYTKIKYLKVLTAAAGVAVSAIVILQRFGVDVLHLYRGFGEEVRLNFVTTLGQVTWTSGYISILLVAGMGVYYLMEEKKKKIFWGICIGTGFAAELLLNCDSGILAVTGAFMILVWLAIGSRERTLRLIELMMTALAAAGIVGILERIFSSRMVSIDTIYFKAAQSMLVYILLAALAVLYLLVKKDKLHLGRKYRDAAKAAYLFLLCMGILTLAALFYLHGKGYFAGSPTENYFRFTVWWGNSRGFIWRVGAAVFGDFGIGRKLFGCGPDCFMPYAYGLMGDAINEFWHNQIVPNVHNEWFNAVINYGIIGGAAYLGIFVSSAWSLMKSGIDKAGSAVVFGTGLAAAAYIVHNILCYQQIIGTPLIFILIGLGAAIVRRGGK